MPWKARPRVQIMVEKGLSVMNYLPPSASRKSSRKEPTSDRKVSRNRRPQDLSLEEWQVLLRRQYGREQHFQMENLGEHPVFSEFSVTNPQSQRTYRVAIRGEALGESECTCPDYATNTLGTCKHVEFVLARLQAEPALACQLRLGFRPPHSEVRLRYGSQRQVVLTLGTEAPRSLHDAARKYFDTQGVLKEIGFHRFGDFLKDAGRHVRCSDQALDFVAQVRDNAWRRAHLDHRYSNGEAGLEGLLNTTLYPYQSEGALFAARAGRALLGDEMGLGKTVQALAYAEIVAREFDAEAVLIVCPASLKYQWKQEIERFTNRTAVVIDGLTSQRRQAYETDSFFKIVNYDVLHRDLECIAKLAPDVVILDEAQRIKNWSTRVAQAVKSIQSPYALVLTGTPLENRLEELLSIVQFVDRHRLGPSFRFLSHHQVLEAATGKVIGYRNLSQIGETLQPILLRRKKSEVMQQLPERIEKNFFVPMTPRQRNLHEENREIVARIVARWRRYKFLSEADQRRLMIAMQNMRMACDNTYLLDQQTREGPKLDEMVTVLSEIFEDPESKVIVFSQWQRMNDLVAERLREAGWGYVYLHGGVPSRDRKDLMKRFKEDPAVRVFLSTDAGGVGLNLQRASTVINLDLPWNPAVLEQRIGRAHRIGQQCTVQVVNFISESTIEHGMLDVLRFKKGLFEGALDGGEDDVFMGGTRLTKFMESVESVSDAVPPTVAQEVGEAENDLPEQPVEETLSQVARLPQNGHVLQGGQNGHAPQPGEAPPPCDAPHALAQNGHAAGRPGQSGHAATYGHGASTPDTSLRPLVAAGTVLLRELGTLLSASLEPGKSLLEVDPASGRTYLKVPLPEPEVVQSLAAAIGPLLRMLQPR